jgi:hypothetical protein
MRSSPLRSEAAGGEEGRRKEKVPLIKSRDLYLAGGEKNSCPGLNLCISFIEPSSQHAQMIHCSTVTLLWTKWLTWPSVWVWVEFIQRIGTIFWGISSCYFNINHQITLRKSSWLQTIGASTHTGDRTVVSHLFFDCKKTPWIRVSN